MSKDGEYRKNEEGFTSSNDFDGIIDGYINTMLEKLTGFLFRRIDFDPESLNTLKDYSEKKNIVYVSFHSSNISLLLFCYLLKKHNIDIPIVALEGNPYMMQNIKHVWRRIVKFINKKFLGKQYKHIFETDYIGRKMEEKKTVLISLISRKFFLKRYMEIKYDSLTYLIKLQKQLEDPIFILPQMIFWNLNPERTKSLIASQATGDRGLFSGWLTILKSATPAFIRILPPINVSEELSNYKTTDPEQIAISLRNKLLEMYHHEKRSVIGPVIRSNQEMMEKVLYHGDVLDMIEKQAKREKTSEKKLRKKAYEYYKEIAADYSVLIISFFSLIVSFILNKIFDGIQYDPESIRKIREASKKGPLILVPNHRSSIDYVIISYLFYINKLVCPHIAAGKNLSFFPFGPIARHSGAFFIRRTFRGLKLYPTVFKQYVRTLVSDGYPIEVFMEGTRTRTGKMALPKLGFLYYLIEAVYAGYNDDLVFVPISIDYDRILEEKSYLKELKGHKKEDESISTMIESRKLLKRKYGRVYISFHDPFTLKDFASGITDIKKLPDMVANTILAKISEVTVVTSFGITTAAMLILSHKGFTKSALKNISKTLFLYLVQTEARLSETLHKDANIDDIIDNVVDSYSNDNILHEIKVEGGNNEEIVDDLFLLEDEDRTRICYYKNCIVHYFVPIAFTSLAVLYFAREKDGKEIREADVKKEYNFIKDLFRREFLYTDDDSDDNIINEKVYNFYSQESILIRDKNYLLLLSDKSTDVVKLFSSIMKDHFESYYIVLKTIIDLKKDQIKKDDLITTVRKNALKMFHLGEIDLAESLSLPNYVNAISRFTDDGILKGGAREIKNIDIKIADIEKAKNYLEKVEEYLNIIR